MISDSLKVFSGNANPKLAHAVAQYLNIPLGRATVNRFSDGEVMVEINENVRGCDAFVLQSTCADTAIRFIFTGNTALGCISRWNSFFTLRNKSSRRTFLTPPAVEPAQPPATIV